MSKHEKDFDPCNRAPNTESHELSITRFINAPPEKVYRVWTERADEWFAPKPHTAKIDMDVRAGGRFNMNMRSPEGQDMPHSGVFLEVVPNKKLVTTDAFTDGWNPQQAFMVAITTFEPEGSGTRYTARVRHWDEEARKRHEAMGFTEGWTIVAGQLAALAEAA